MLYILDFETNGLSLSDVEVTELAYLKLDDNLNIVEEFDKYYFAKNLKDSDKITGLDYVKLARLSNGEEMTKSELKRLMEQFKHNVIIGQNITYDIMVMDSLCIRYGLGVYPKYPLDIINQYSPEETLVSLNWIVKHRMKEEGVKLVKNRFKNDKDAGFHNALYDIYQVYALIKYDTEFKFRLMNYLRSLPGVS